MIPRLAVFIQTDNPRVKVLSQLFQPELTILVNHIRTRAVLLRNRHRPRIQVQNSFLHPLYRRHVRMTIKKYVTLLKRRKMFSVKYVTMEFLINASKMIAKYFYDLNNHRGNHGERQNHSVKLTAQRAHGE